MTANLINMTPDTRSTALLTNLRFLLRSGPVVLQVAPISTPPAATLRRSSFVKIHFGYFVLLQCHSFSDLVANPSISVSLWISVRTTFGLLLLSSGICGRCLSSIFFLSFLSRTDRYKENEAFGSFGPTVGTSGQLGPSATGLVRTPRGGRERIRLLGAKGKIKKRPIQTERTVPC